MRNSISHFSKSTEVPSIQDRRTPEHPTRRQQKSSTLTKQEQNGNKNIINACSEGNQDTLVNLIQNLASIDDITRKEDEATLFYIAAKKGYTEIAELLLEKGADMKKSNSNGITPLAVASEKGHFEIITKMLDRIQTEAELNTLLRIQTEQGAYSLENIRKEQIKNPQNFNSNQKNEKVEAYQMFLKKIEAKRKTLQAN